MNINNNKIESEHVKDVYEKIAMHFSNTRVYTWDWIRDFIERQPSNSVIYDIGCGNGRNMIQDRKNNKKFIGIDNCGEFLKICRERRLDVVEASMVNIPLKTETADAIICIAAFHHLSKIENRIESLIEMKRLIKPNGRILLSVWAKEQPTKTRRTFAKYGHNIVQWNKFGEKYERYYYIFERNEIEQLIKVCGLVIKSYSLECGNMVYELLKI